ncbi:MAG: hypothetical protein AAFN70_03835, partial [Planctomycetota bacterium]
MALFGLWFFQKTPPHGRVEKHVANFHHRSGGTATGNQLSTWEPAKPTTDPFKFSTDGKTALQNCKALSMNEPLY